MVMDKLLRMGEGRKAKQTQKIVDQVNALSDDMAALSDGDLQAKTDEFRARLADGADLDDLQVEAFAVVREAAWRVLKQRPYDVQVFGGVALHNGNIAEMRTGEGKTLTSTMPVYLNALAGEGVHVVTVNEYLAKRDAEWMGRVHHWLGITVGVVHSGQTRDAKRAAYGCDVTYGTNNEFGFDYLRDNMALDKRLQVQRGHFMALVDEVDSILVDEARTPLIISGPAEQSADLYQVFARRVAPNLTKGEEGDRPGEATGDYVVDEAKRTVAVTEDGVSKVEQLLGIENMYESVNTPLIHHLQNALKAKELFKRDREYIVVDGEVKIVDENTGRVLDGRRYSEGLHQSIEAKEGVKVKEENQTLATITLQNYYRTYDKLAGMTGTAKTEEVEFLEIYELGVVEVPTNRPVQRDDRADLIFKTEKAKFAAVAEEIQERHEAGQPILIGTTSVEKSEYLATLLTRMGIRHEVLNAKNHAREAHIVAQAGRLGAVTVSTNMAGRGTDIVLGGNAEEVARHETAQLPDDLPPEERDAAYFEAIERLEAEFGAEGEKVKELGGLYVIGTERHESRRVDNQLRGRSGRQGDPGTSRFFLSLEDDLMRLFNAAAVERIMTRLKIPEDVPIEHKWVTRAVANAQRQVESLNFDRRKNVLKYDDVMNEQRKVVYGQRQSLLEGDVEAISELSQKYVEDTVEGLVDEHCPPGVYPEEWDLDGLAERLQMVYDTTFDFGGLDLETVDRDKLVELLIDDAFDAYERREAEVGGEEVMREIERRVILSVVDRKWREHLYEMDALRDGIGLRAVGQRDPLTEYQREAYDSFVAMMSGVKEEATTYFFRLPIRQEAEGGEGGEGGEVESRPAGGAAGAPTEGDVSGNGGAPSNGDAGGDAPDGDAAHGDAPASPTERVEQAIPLGEQRRSAARLTYTAGAPAGSASYAVSAGSTTASVRTDDAGRSVEQKSDGSTVRRVAAGDTYRASEKVGRNDPCPCGSGKKFKKCHGAEEG
ncbi:preprotein translocase subunit SecA [Egicoccus halophilus]|uniref:Protein translocase subunit SecA n=1 Tax=Egicoccus halophilus TaxID=1670830 RepID=A0A8J3A5V4_9ACTN|nr:preprotein translocase subunit SecA [Egicoccus halophilus]GGI03930.1 protein translocase subunit SecA [Egicoccus halophilus]